MEQVIIKKPTFAEAIDDLLRQRQQLATMVEHGDNLVKPSIEFIDNILLQFVPEYVPPSVKKCCCEDK